MAGAANKGEWTQALANGESRFACSVGSSSGTVKLVGRKGRVFREQDSQGQQIIVHIVILHMCKVPDQGGPWSLHFSVEEDALG